MKDLESVEKTKENFNKEAKSGNKEAIRKLEIMEIFCQALNKGKVLSEIELSEDSQNLTQELCLLTIKPIIYVFNSGELPATFDTKTLGVQNSLNIDLKTEEEISEFSESEIKELAISSKIGELISLCYKTLELIPFYTIKGGIETRAWTLKQGGNILDAAEKVHSDFKEKFIKAEVVSFEKLINSGSWQSAREKGWIETAGKEYIVKDGDIIEFRI